MSSPMPVSRSPTKSGVSLGPTYDLPHWSQVVVVSPRMRRVRFYEGVIAHGFSFHFGFRSSTRRSAGYEPARRGDKSCDHVRGRHFLGLRSRGPTAVSACITNRFGLHWRIGSSPAPMDCASGAGIGKDPWRLNDFRRLTGSRREHGLDGLDGLLDLLVAHPISTTRDTHRRWQGPGREQLLGHQASLLDPAKLPVGAEQAATRRCRRTPTPQARWPMMATSPAALPRPGSARVRKRQHERLESIIRYLTA